MKIAVVSPSPVPFTIGGAENLAWGLCDSINKYTSNQAELIKVPVNEFSFWDLIDSYFKFYNMNLDHFDLIITTKYLAWMVRHKNSIVYMLHTLRGLYDTYSLMGKSEEVPKGVPAIDDLLEFMQQNKYEDALDDFFEKLYDLKNDETIPQPYFEFPGALIRKVVHYMDLCALSQSGVKKWCAISNVVKNRKDYFPVGVNVDVIYPPTILKENTFGDYEYLFMCSRLDSPKRIDMLIRAMKHVKNNVKLYIAGTGPERDKLEALASGDKRIQFLGFVTDEEVEKYYSNAICVPYFPYDEDYGYITIEAMLHKKTVITTKDSGGPNEFVMNNETGFSVDFDEYKIAEKIDYLIDHKEQAKAMGERAYDIVKEITWENAVESILNMPEYVSDINSRKKIIVTSTFSVYPPMGGGQARIYNLYKNIAKEYEVKIIAYDTCCVPKKRHKIAYGLEEIVVPKSEMHQDEETKIEEAVGFPITDIAMPMIGELTPEFGDILEKESLNADLIVVSHPYTYIQVKNHARKIPFIYEAHNVEYLMKKKMLPENEIGKKLVDNLFAVEKECCQKSKFILTCSEEDKATIMDLYGVDAGKIIVVPNGVDCDATQYVDINARLENKKEHEISDEKIGIFMGSWHMPNLEAAEEVINIARKCPREKFLLIGSQCSYFKDKELPRNVGLLGLVSEKEKLQIFKTVDFALNPMKSGSGTNLKMFDYMSAGIPVISNLFGTRGIDDKQSLIIAESDEMPNAIEKFNLKECITKVGDARKYIEDTFDWKVIAKIYLDRLKREL